MTKKYRITLIIVLLLISPSLVFFSSRTSNSIDLVNELRSKVHPETLFVDEDKISDEEWKIIEYMQNTSPLKDVSQFTVLEFEGKSFLVESAPGETKMKILSIEELPAEIEAYFINRK